MQKEETEEKRGRGRPKVVIDWSKLEMALQLGASLEMTAGFLDVSEDSIERHIKAEKQMTFKEYRKRKMSLVKLRLIQKAQSKALDGDNVMLIFCLKNICGWSDRTDSVIEEVKSFKFSYDEKEKSNEDLIE